ncbi:hypothetical protein QCD71_06435 [Sphingomonas sp. PsM26]|nr:hypothetical protein [Sphingomonas sp. PsM26]
MRCLLLGAVLLIAASPQPSANPPPAVLTPYIQNGSFEPGNFHWLRGAFDGANAADKAADVAIVAWRQRCRASDLATTRSELATMGVIAGVSLNSIPYRTLLCNQIASLPEPLNLHDWTGFDRDVAVVQPIAQGFLAAVTFGEAASEARTPALGDLLQARVVGEQVLRRGLGWANGETDDAQLAALTPQQRGILVSRLAMAMAARDQANTLWLKGIVASQGWPTRAMVGDAGSSAAWLLVQHADADPAFQARVLRSMEPLVTTGQVSPKSYAYLYDRVMLKLVGKQRYATQLTCRAGHYVPQPIENDLKVDSLRRGVGLGLLSEYAEKANRKTDGCTDVPVDS